MKQLYLFIFLMLSFQISEAQYLETFATSGRGVLLGPCSTTEGRSCFSHDFSGGIYWNISGNLSGIDSEGLSTKAGGYLHFEDVDEEACWVSPPIDISGVPVASIDVDFEIPSGATWETSTTVGSTDYADIKYSVDGAAFITLSNISGCPGSGHTISASSCASGLSGPISYTPNIPGLVGNSVTVMFCLDTNASSDDGFLHSVAVPESGAVVPVTWNDFNIVQQDDGNLLKWSTESELNNDYFQVERSTNNVEKFDVLTRIEGAYTSTEVNNYSFLDEEIEPGTVYFYRVRQVDLNGETSVSRLLSVTTPDTREVIITPNPFYDIINIQVEETSNKSSQVDIYNAQGQVVESITIPANSESYQINTTQWVPGIYYASTNFSDFTKIVKTN